METTATAPGATFMLARELLRLPAVSHLVGSFASHVNLAATASDDLDIAVDEGLHTVDLFGAPGAPVTVHLNPDHSLGLSVTISAEATEGLTEDLVRRSPTLGMLSVLVDNSLISVEKGLLRITLNVRK